LVDFNDTIISAFAIINTTPYLIETILSAIIIVIGYLINRFFVQKSIDEFSDRADLDIHHRTPLKRFFSIILWLIVIFIILGVFGLEDILWGAFAAVGFAGIVIGMATRDVVSDMLTGLLLYVYRPFKIGDSVMISDIGGTIKDIEIGGVRIKAWSGEIVTIPNSKVRTSIIKNYSIDVRRASIDLYVDYNSDFNKAIEICYRVLDNVPEALKDPKSIISIDDFKEQYVKISILVWFSIDEFSKGCNKLKKLLAEEFNSKDLKAPVIRTKEIPNNS